jgi:HSP20 family protein
MNTMTQLKYSLLILQRKYRKIIELPSEADIGTARSTYKNGILEIVFSKKNKTKR